jgi:hypothetical protein
MLGKDFREFVVLLNAHGVEYLVVGAYAVGAHGHPRYTGDLDVWVRSSPGNAARVVSALNDFGFASFNLNPGDFTEPGRILQLGQPPVRIDIMTSIDGVSFDAAYPQRLIVEFDELPVSFIGLEDLKLNKRMTGRPKDRLDYDELSGSS